MSFSVRFTSLSSCPLSLKSSSILLLLVSSFDSSTEIICLALTRLNGVKKYTFGHLLLSISVAEFDKSILYCNNCCFAFSESLYARLSPWKILGYFARIKL